MPIIHVYRSRERVWNLATKTKVEDFHRYSFEPIAETQFTTEGTYSKWEQREGRTVFGFARRRMLHIPCEYGHQSIEGVTPIRIKAPIGYRLETQTIHRSTAYQENEPTTTTALIGGPRGYNAREAHQAALTGTELRIMEPEQKHEPRPTRRETPRLGGLETGETALPITPPWTTEPERGGPGDVPGPRPGGSDCVHQEDQRGAVGPLPARPGDTTTAEMTVQFPELGIEIVLPKSASMIGVGIGTPTLAVEGKLYSLSCLVWLAAEGMHGLTSRPITPQVDSSSPEPEPAQVVTKEPKHVDPYTADRRPPATGRRPRQTPGQGLLF